MLELLVHAPGERRHVAVQQMEAHERAQLPDTGDGGHGPAIVPDALVHLGPQHVPGEAALAGEHQDEAVLQLAQRPIVEVEKLDVDPLEHARPGREVLDPRREPADLVLPSPARPHHLLGREHAVVDGVVGAVHAERPA